MGASGRGSSGSVVGSARGTVIGFVVMFGWGGNSIVVAGQGSGCGATVVVVGEGAGGGIVSRTGRGAGSDVPFMAGSPLGGAGVVNPGHGCNIRCISYAYNTYATNFISILNIYISS